MKLSHKVNVSEEWDKAHWSYPGSVTKGEQKPDQKGGMRSTVADGYNYQIDKTPKGTDDVGIKLICWRLNDFGFTTTLSRKQLLLDHPPRWAMYISATANSTERTLRIALRTSHEKLSHRIYVIHATGEVSVYLNTREVRGSIVPNNGKQWPCIPKNRDRQLHRINKQTYLLLGTKGLITRSGRDLNTWHIDVRSYTTKGGKRKLAPVVELHKDFRILAKHWWVCHKNRGKTFKSLRGLLKLNSLWFAAYLKLKKNKGSGTPAPDLKGIDTLTKAKILEIKQIVLKREYDWVGVKEVMIPKPGKPGKKRPLGIPAINDRLVQEVVRTIIEPIFELNFSNQSHGFRPNRGCHTALKWINTQMKDSIWFIEGDIKSYFPTVNHEILMKLISRRVKDPIITKLIRDGLKARVFTRNEGKYIPELGTPQGGILSPLLSNVYLHEFDRYMETLMREYKRGTKYRKINKLPQRLLKAGKKKEKYRLRVPLIDPHDTENINCKYVRYADDFLIGVMGSRKMATEIKHKVAMWLKKELKIELSIEKTHVTNVSKGIPFLGYKFGRRTIVIRQKYADHERNRKMTIPTLDVDMDRVIKRLSAAGYCDGKGNPTPMFKHLQPPQSETNKEINYILRGLSECWAIAGNRVKALARLSYIMRMSIAKVYAAKFGLRTTAAVFEIGSNDLSKPIGKRAKSVIGVGETVIPGRKTLTGLLYTKYNEIPRPKGNKMKPNWRPAYLEALDRNIDPEEFIKQLWEEGMSKENNPMIKL